MTLALWGDRRCPVTSPGDRLAAFFQERLWEIFCLFNSSQRGAWKTLEHPSCLPNNPFLLWASTPEPQLLSCMREQRAQQEFLFYDAAIGASDCDCSLFKFTSLACTLSSGSRTKLSRGSSTHGIPCCGSKKKKRPGPFGPIWAHLARFSFFERETAPSESALKPEGVWFQKTESAISKTDFYFRLLAL